ncbi:hypothetical protein BU204_20790 [Actinophytocola xanthii]|uniref:Uncharacterized protein n=1 Tax=Actinophytocola xanthii TaxID=1912961 RepID=A0A1Q8CMU5_9PSEU|nr:hypothetical protein BU204_20790 [Actinophytocola xanthii]
MQAAAASTTVSASTAIVLRAIRFTLPTSRHRYRLDPTARHRFSLLGPTMPDRPRTPSFR